VFGPHIPTVTAAQIPANAEVPNKGDVVVVCRSGGRSGQVVAYLLGNGWDNVSNLDGGMQDWAATGRELVSEDGQPARVL
jgi:rhodanese-related sulfurtransferase